MKGVIMSLYTLSIGAGSKVTALVTRNVDFASRTNYFLFWAAFMTAGAILFAVIAALYKPVPFVAAGGEAAPAWAPLRRGPRPVAAPRRAGSGAPSPVTP